jgi:hypothetical protein
MVITKKRFEKFVIKNFQDLGRIDNFKKALGKRIWNHQNCDSRTQKLSGLLSEELDYRSKVAKLEQKDTRMDIIFGKGSLEYSH